MFFCSPPVKKSTLLGLFAAGIVVFCLLGLSRTVLAATLSDLRVGLHGDITRVVIESDQKFPYRLFQLQQPARLIIDGPSMTWRVNNSRLAERSPLIAKSRFGLFRPDVLRVVFDLTHAVKIVRHVMFKNAAGKWLLMVEFQRASRGEESTRNIFEDGWQEYIARANKKKPDKVARAPRRGEKKVSQIVVIDPGHGGLDPGALGDNKIYEKHIVLAVSRHLRKALEKMGIETHLTRNSDYYVPLATRFRIAEQKRATLFVSIHADAADNPKAYGASIYTLSDKASDREAEKLAQKENASDTLVGISDLDDYEPSVQRILLSMSHRATQRESSRIAKNLLQTMSKEITMKSHAHRSAGFAVLKSPSVPSVLVELGYISNSRDRKLLQNTNHQKKLARTLAKGIRRYLERLK